MKRGEMIKSFFHYNNEVKKWLIQKEDIHQLGVIKGELIIS